MGLKHRPDSIAGIRLREAQRTKIAISAELLNGSIVLEMPEGGVCTGTMVKFTAPCNCDAVTGGLTIDGVTYTVVDAMGECVTGASGGWKEGAQIAVLIDNENKAACIQNAATKGIFDKLNEAVTGVLNKLNAHIKDKNNPHKVKASQVGVGEDVKTALKLVDNATVDAALLTMFSATCSIAAGSYIGSTPISGDDVPFTIEFPFKPKLIVCTPYSSTVATGWIYSGGKYVFLTAHSSGYQYQNISLTGNIATISPYSKTNSNFYEIDLDGAEYCWVALG